jgi:hypothetical protein
MVFWEGCLVYVRESSPMYERTNQERAKERSKALVETAWRSGIDAKVEDEKRCCLAHTPPEFQGGRDRNLQRGAWGSET